MLIKPSILKAPVSSFSVNNTVGCSVPYTAPGNGNYKCLKAFSCNPYSYNSNSCVDCSYTTCSYTLGGTAVTVVVTVGIAIAAPAIT